MKLEDAIRLAVMAHEGQTYGYGDFVVPKVAHPFEVMFKVREMYLSGKYAILTRGYTLEEFMIAAILHDTVEDTQVTLKQIEDMFGRRVAKLVDGVTRRVKEGEKYKPFIYRIKLDKAVTFLKLGDLYVNMGHIDELPEEKKSIVYRYMTAVRVLLEDITWERASYEAKHGGGQTTITALDADGVGRVEITEVPKK